MKKYKILLFFLICSAPALIHAKPSINLNTATYEELVSLPHVNSGQARNIINYRINNNGFTDVKELEDILSVNVVRKLQQSYEIYVISKDAWGTGFIERLDFLGSARLIIKSLPLEGNAIFIMFPDGGNMLIDTGSKGESEKSIKLLKKEISGKKESGFMKLLGWKPRIDCLVITGSKKKRRGGLSGIAENFKIIKIITSLSGEGENAIEFRRELDSFMILDSIYTNLSHSRHLDVKQTVSPVKVELIVHEYYEEGTSLNLSISYLDFTFLFLSDLSKERQAEFIRNYTNLTKNTCIFYDEIEGIPEKKTGISYFLKSSEGRTVVTDGYLIFKSEGIVDVPLITRGKKITEKSIQKIKIKEIKKRYYRALRLYEMEEYLNSISECKNILEIEPSHKNSIKLIRKAEEKLLMKKRKDLNTGY